MEESNKKKIEAIENNTPEGSSWQNPGKFPEFAGQKSHQVQDSDEHPVHQPEEIRDAEYERNAERDKEFEYFFHGTDITDKSMMEDIFNNGLKSYRGNSLTSTMYPKKIEYGELGKELEKYSGIKGDDVVIARIPKVALHPKVSADGKMLGFPLPIWKPARETDGYGRECKRLTPELIYGIYKKADGSFVPNPNYMPAFDPTGLQHDVLQEEHVFNSGNTNLINYVSERKGKSFEELAQADKTQHVWDKVVSQYREHFVDDKRTTSN